MKQFKGKALYNPSGKAGEYSYWACNFYIGRSNNCTYCYCKKGILAGAMGQDKPQLKKCFKDEDHALEVFQKELLGNLEELRKHGLFFSFTTDPLLPETMGLTFKAIYISYKNDVPVKVLTKRADMAYWAFAGFGIVAQGMQKNKHLISIGFTLTGHDELEPGASTNQERIETMKALHYTGFKTFASIEPVIDFASSEEMIRKTERFCDLYKIGLESGKRYDKEAAIRFIYWCNAPAHINGETFYHKVYFKDSLLKVAGKARESLPHNCVGRDYNMFG